MPRQDLFHVCSLRGDLFHVCSLRGDLLQGLHLQDALESKRCKSVALTIIKLGLELNPVKSEGVEKSTEPLHQEQDGNGQVSPDEEDNKDDNTTYIQPTNCHAQMQHHVPQHLRQLCRGKCVQNLYKNVHIMLFTDFN